MIKELFTTCLLSASVGTSGLNMQTRDVNNNNFEIIVRNTNNTPTSSKTQTSDTIIKEYYKTETVITGNLQTIWYQKGFEKRLYDDENQYNSFAEHSYDIIMIDIQAKNGNFVTSNMIIDSLQYDLSASQSTSCVISSTMLITTMPNMIEEFMSIKITENSFYDDLRDFYMKTQWSEFGYNYTTITSFYSSTNYSNNTLRNTWTLQDQGLPLTQQHIYMFILTDVNGEDGESYSRNETANYQMLVNSIGHGVALEGTLAFSYSQEIINIPGLMFTVLTMPFTFISQAFNLTLFPGTPYQLNISALFLAIIGTLIFVWIISTILKKR